MNRLLTLAAFVAILLGLATSAAPTQAQVFDEYGVTKVLNRVPFEELTSKTVLPASRFALPPNFIQGTVTGRDDGFVQVSLPWPFEYNGEVYTKVWICVNGYIMFSDPPSTLLPKNENMNITDWFFYHNSSYPDNVIAPYMGDHFYRTGDDNPIPWPNANQYVPSEISYYADDSVFTVQWKNLNINFDDPNDPQPTAGITSSIATFQVKLYRSHDVFSKQGDIEFCYGQTGPIGVTQYTNQVLVNTRNAVVGIKGNSGRDGEFSDFLNGLVFAKAWDPDDVNQWNKEEAKHSTLLTTTWQPSGGTDYRIRFFALGRNQKEEYWGDGDADLSQLEGQRQGNMSQPRFVTVRDARNIIRSVVTRKPLPKERRREAYHGDVNHNGRWFYYHDNAWLGWTDDGTSQTVYPKDTIFKVKIPWKNMYYGDSIQYILHDVWDPVNSKWEYNKVVPSQIASLSEIFYEANEYDAALILHYLGGRIPSLPYLVDSIGQYGKFADNEIASDIRFGEAIKENEGVYKVPVYLNGYFNGPIAIKLETEDAAILGVSNYGDLMVSYGDDIAAIVGDGEFTPDKPVCVLRIAANGASVKFKNIRYNDVDKGDAIASLPAAEKAASELSMVAKPNPMTESVVISINVPDLENARLIITDVNGSVVKRFDNVKNGELTWDGKDELGREVSSGIYLCKLLGSDVNITKKLSVAR